MASLAMKLSGGASNVNGVELSVHFEPDSSVTVASRASPQAQLMRTSAFRYPYRTSMSPFSSTNVWQGKASKATLVTIG